MSHGLFRAGSFTLLTHWFTESESARRQSLLVPIHEGKWLREQKGVSWRHTPGKRAGVRAQGCPASFSAALCQWQGPGSGQSESGAHLGGADGLTKLAGDAALLPGWVTAQCMLPAEAWAQRALLKRVVDGGWLPEQVAQSHAQTWEQHRHGGWGPSSPTMGTHPQPTRPCPQLLPRASSVHSRV